MEQTISCKKCGSAELYKKSYCKPCQLQYQKDWYKNNADRERKKRYLEKRKRNEEIKGFLDNEKSKPCSDCKISYHPFVMDYDHVDPKKKKMMISQAVRRGATLESVKRELEKCELVCANCHRMRTLRQMKNTGL